MMPLSDRKYLPRHRAQHERDEERQQDKERYIDFRERRGTRSSTPPGTIPRHRTVAMGAVQKRPDELVV